MTGSGVRLVTVPSKVPGFVRYVAEYFHRFACGACGASWGVWSRSLVPEVPKVCPTCGAGPCGCVACDP